MPNDLLDLNLGQVQAVIEGYDARVVDSVCQAVWTGYYAAYYFSKHPKKPTEIIKQILSETTKEDKTRGNIHKAVDMDAEIELFAQRDLLFFQTKGVSSNE